MRSGTTLWMESLFSLQFYCWQPKSRYGSMIGLILSCIIYSEKTSLISFGNGDNGEARKQMEEVFHLVNIISRAGEALDKYIQAHSEVPQLSVYCSYSDTWPFTTLQGWVSYLIRCNYLGHTVCPWGCFDSVQHNQWTLLDAVKDFDLTLYFSVSLLKGHDAYVIYKTHAFIQFECKLSHIFQFHIV